MCMGFFAKFLNIFKSSAQQERERNVEEYEDVFLEADFGSAISYELSETLMKRAKEEKQSDGDSLKHIIKEELSKYIKSYDVNIEKDKCSVFMLFGVNGVGKTTTAAKLAKLYKKDNFRVLLSAADTFRAAASEQLLLHGERLGIEVISPPKAGNPAAVVYDTLDAAQKRNTEVVVVDTAGRLHNKENLIKEMQKVDKIVNGRIEKQNYLKFLVLDTISGQNLYSQATIFNEALNIDALILTKLDSGAKGGAVVRIAKELNLPIAYICTGEGYDDIEKFDKEKFLENLIT